MVRQGAGHRGGEGLGNEVELRGPHTSHLHSVFLLNASQEKRWQSPVKPHTEQVLQGSAWQKVKVGFLLREPEPNHVLLLLRSE